MPLRFFVLLSLFTVSLCAKEQHVKPGIDVLIDSPELYKLKGKNIGLVTNHTAVSRNMMHTFDLLKSKEKEIGYKIKALFAPEHGLFGGQHNNEHVNSFTTQGIPVHSLHGKTKRPTEDMLKGLDVIIYDIQDIGSRSYTYTTTMFYVIEESAKHGIEVLILDRPNPIGGMIVDGPLLDNSLRSMVGYINVPYCHGMTSGELACYFNKEYSINGKVRVIRMDGWKRGMVFADTGLSWIPTSPQIPEASTSFYYPMTGIIGELSIVSIGIGYTLPFKVIGAPWMDGKEFANQLNSQKFPGVHFEPFSFKPFFGKFSGKDCEGVMIVLRDSTKVSPVRIQFLLIGTLKALYPEKFKECLQSCTPARREMFNKVCGNKEIFNIMEKNAFIVWPLIQFQEKERLEFMSKRKSYLFADYE